MSEASAEIVLGSSLDIDVLVYNLGFLKHLGKTVLIITAYPIIGNILELTF